MEAGRLPAPTPKAAADEGPEDGPRRHHEKDPVSTEDGEAAVAAVSGEAVDHGRQAHRQRQASRRRCRRRKKAG